MIRRDVISGQVRRVARSIAQNGLRKTAQQLVAALNERRRTTPDEFDRTHGIDTSRPASLWALTIRSDNASFGFKYQASQPEMLTLALERIAEDFREFTFVDLGAGKGRMLIVAARYGFKELIGVEFAKELVVAGQKNLHAAALERATISHADAAEFKFPPGNLIVYMYNPFSSEVMEPVLLNLTTTLNTGEAKCYVVYARPTCEDLFDANTAFEPFAEFAGGTPIRVWRYRLSCLSSSN